MRLYIDAEREGYTPEQVYETMTVGELIEVLEHVAHDYDEETPVYLRHDNGYTYGGITSWRINVEDEEEEEEE